MGRPGWSQGKASVGPGEFQSSDAPAMYPRRPCDVPAMSPRFTRTECFLRFGPPHPALTHSLNQRRSKGVWAVTGTRMNTNYTWILSGGFVICVSTQVGDQGVRAFEKSSAQIHPPLQSLDQFHANQTFQGDAHSIETDPKHPCLGGFTNGRGAITKRYWASLG